MRVADYGRRRFLRIVPAYWLALVVVVVLIGHHNGVTTHNWWIFFGFGQTYQLETMPQGIGAAWTLCVEVTFYALLPVLAVVGARLGRNPRSLHGDLALVVVLGIASVAIHQYIVVGTSHGWTAVNLPGSFYWFALGMALAIASVLHEGRSPGRGVEQLLIRWPTAFWLAAVAVFVVLCAWAPHNARGVGTGSTTEFVLYGLVALLVLLPATFAADSGGVARRALRAPALAWVGLVSYGVYLYHADLIVVVDRHTRGLPHRYLSVMILAFFVTCLVAGASYYLWERPILRLKEVPFSKLASRFTLRG